MELLEQYDARATFFVLGENAEEYPDVITELYENGFEIGNGTYDDTNLTTLSDDEIETEISKTQNIIYSLTGSDPVVARPPGAATNSDVKDIYSKYNLTQVIWSLDCYDWSTNDPDAIAERVVNNASSDYIIRMDDNKEYDLEALKIILPTLVDQGYQFVTVSTLLANQ